MNNEDWAREKIHNIVHNEETVLLQKNARCPKCGGTLRSMNGPGTMYIWCINCYTHFVPQDIGLTDNEVICYVMPHLRSHVIKEPIGYLTNDGYLGRIDDTWQLYPTEEEYLEALKEA